MKNLLISTFSNHYEIFLELFGFFNHEIFNFYKKHDEYKKIIEEKKNFFERYLSNNKKNSSQKKSDKFNPFFVEEFWLLSTDFFENENLKKNLDANDKNRVIEIFKEQFLIFLDYINKKYGLNIKVKIFVIKGVEDITTHENIIKYSDFAYKFVYFANLLKQVDYNKYINIKFNETYNELLKKYGFIKNHNNKNHNIIKNYNTIKSYNIIKKYKNYYRFDNVFLSPVSGRKFMSSALEHAGYLFGDDAVVHILSKKVENSDSRIISSLFSNPEELKKINKKIINLFYPVILKKDIADKQYYSENFIADREKDFDRFFKAFIKLILKNYNNVFDIIYIEDNFLDFNLYNHIVDYQEKMSSTYLNFNKNLINSSEPNNFRILYTLDEDQINLLKNTYIGNDYKFKSKEIEFIRKLPKVDLHCHIGGILDVRDILNISYEFYGIKEVINNINNDINNIININNIEDYKDGKNNKDKIKGKKGKSKDNKNNYKDGRNKDKTVDIKEVVKEKVVNYLLENSYFKNNKDIQILFEKILVYMMLFSHLNRISLDSDELYESNEPDYIESQVEMNDELFFKFKKQLIDIIIDFIKKEKGKHLIDEILNKNFINKHDDENKNNIENVNNKNKIKNEQYKNEQYKNQQYKHLFIKLLKPLFSILLERHKKSNLNIEEFDPVLFFILLFYNKSELLERLIFEDLLYEENFKNTGIELYSQLGDIQGSSIYNSKKVVKLALKIFFEKMKKENVKYIELRGSFAKYTKYYNEIEIIRTVIETIKKYAEPDLIVRLILIINRGSDDEYIKQSIRLINKLKKEYKEALKYLVGFDVAGNESKRKASELRPFLIDAMKDCPHITIHAGETESVDSIWEALYHLNAERIGHGLKLNKNEKLKSKIRDLKTIIEMCPSSNYQIVGYKEFMYCYENDYITDIYPLKDYLDYGLKVTINTDNPGISRTDITNEFYKAAKMINGGLSIWDILMIIKNSFKGTFLDYETKKRLILKAEKEIIEILQNLSIK